MHLALFGPPTLSTNGSSQTLRTNNPNLALIYLASRADWVSRSELAFLYKPDETEEKALTYLRLQLYRAKQNAWAAQLEVEPNQLRWRVATDVQAFRQAVQNENWQEAIALYKAPFLARQSFRGLVTYAAWAELEREQLEQSYALALRNETERKLAEADFAGASALSSRLFALDDLNEDALHLHLRCLALAGQKSRALKQFQAYKTLLADEFDLDPRQSTLELVQAIEADEVTAKARASTPTRRPTLPQQGTRFVGRKQELRQLQSLLVKPECRLVTVVGLGGTGKTRLALELARLEQSRFKDGVCFVPLAALNSADTFITTLAQALGLTLVPKKDHLEQVKAYLNDKELLLLLDNFEHLLEAAPVIADLLESAAGLKILVTSRESLKLRSEWLYDLRGLSVQEDTEAKGELGHSDSVQLFINSAKRVVPTLEFSESDLVDVAQICRRVEGLPLAIELAASWSRIMPVGRIAKELREGYDLLETEHADVPARHRNLVAILDKTWQGLSARKRETLAKFSVFHGGCTLEAAEEVTGTHFSVLLSLVNESLLKRVISNRFEMHELIRKHAYQNLHSKSEDLEVALKKHADYYQNELIEAQPKLKKTNKNKLDSVTEDLENFTAAWHYLVRHQQLEHLDKLNEAMYTYYFTTGRFREGLTLFTSTTSFMKDAAAPVLAKLKISEGRFWHRQGELGKAKNALARALAIAETHQDESAGPAHSFLGDCCYETGDYGEAKSHYEAAQVYFQNVSDWQGLARIYNMLGNLAKGEGKFDLARTQFVKSLLAFTDLADSTGRANVLNNLANLAEAQGDYAAAKANYLDCLAIFEETKFVRGVAVVKNNLGVVSLKLGDLTEAETFVKESLELKRTIADPISIVLSQVTLADILLAKRDIAGAERYAVKAFRTALCKDYRRIISKSAPTLVKLCYHAGENTAAATLLKALRKQVTKSPSLEELMDYKSEVASPSQVGSSFELIEIVKKVSNILSQEASLT